MKVHLMFENADFNAKAKAPRQAEALMADLDLDPIIEAMAEGDEHIDQIAYTALLNGPGLSAETIAYRQAVFADAMAHERDVRQMMQTAGAGIARAHSSAFHVFSDAPSMQVYRAVQIMRVLTDTLEELRRTGTGLSGPVHSAGLSGLVKTLRDNLDDIYLEKVRATLDALTFKDGVPIGARLGETGHGADYDLLELDDSDKGWRRLLHRFNHQSFTYRLPPRDESGFRALSELEDRGLDQVAGAMTQAVEHILSFLQRIHDELGFYVGALNLYHRLDRLGLALAIPEISEPGTGLVLAGVYDMALALRAGGAVVPNDVKAIAAPLIVITGANQGGKSTLLRAIGQAALLMQAGLFTPAGAHRTAPVTALFSHFARAEDRTLKAGKFEEELQRMSTIADGLTKGAMVLFNESFAATNEREGALVARQILDALTRSGVRSVFVTHSYDLGQSLIAEPLAKTVFLRAEAGKNGKRPFKLIEAPPEPTSHGADLYAEIFGAGTSSAA